MPTLFIPLPLRTRGFLRLESCFSLFPSEICIFFMCSVVELELQMIMTDCSFMEFFLFGKCSEDFNTASVTFCEDRDTALQKTLECIFLIFCDVCTYVNSHLKKKRVLYPLYFILKCEGKIIPSEKAVHTHYTWKVQCVSVLCKCIVHL